MFFLQRFESASVKTLTRVDAVFIHEISDTIASLKLPVAVTIGVY